jgi:hypothetical protein
VEWKELGRKRYKMIGKSWSRKNSEGRGIK